jgi:uncharacterized protein (UPF0333 family)
MDTSQPEGKSPVNLPVVIIIAIVVLVIGTGSYYIYSGITSSTKTNDSVAASLTDTESTAKETTQASPTPSANTTKITVAEEGKIILTGGYADPTVAATSTGYRMYVNRQSGGPSGYMTFVSTDGKNWTKEKDSVISGAATGRAVTLPTGIRFYYPGMQPIKPSDPPADMFSAFSTDGVTFKKDAGTILSPSDSDHYVEGPTVFQLPDKSWRMYFNENTTAAGNQRDGIIWGASSKDGLTWTRDATPTLEADATELGNTPQWKQVLHPFVIANPKGGYIMFYNSHSEIFAATSTDGLKWTKTGKVGIHGADIDGYFQADGTLRVFYGDFSPATQGVVYMGVLNIK